MVLERRSRAAEGASELGQAGAGGADDPLRVLVVDDHDVVREGLKGALASDPRFVLVGEAANGRNALQSARRTLPDVVVLDLHLPDVSGEEVCSLLRGLLPSAVILVLTSYLTEETVRRVARAGASAYVTKAAGLPQLRAALDEIWADRGQSIDVSKAPQIVRYLEDVVRERSDDRAPTPQQARVLELAADGLTYREIADRLGISESTVRFHIQKLKVKFETSSKTELIVQAIRTGMIAPREHEARSTGA